MGSSCSLRLATRCSSTPRTVLVGAGVRRPVVRSSRYACSGTCVGRPQSVGGHDASGVAARVLRARQGTRAPHGWRRPPGAHANHRDRVAPPPAGASVVADIGGGPGRYTTWLADLGHRVHHRDVVPLHVEQVRDANVARATVGTAVGDARSLDLDDASVDAVLLLGPLYHLSQRRDRVRALRGHAASYGRGARLRRRDHSGRRGSACSRSSCTRPSHDRRRARPLNAPANCDRSSPAPSTASCTGPRSCAPSSGPPTSRSSTSSASRARPPCSPIWTRASTTRTTLVWSSTPRALERVPELLGLGPHLLATATAVW